MLKKVNLEILNVINYKGYTFWIMVIVLCF